MIDIKKFRDYIFVGATLLFAVLSLYVLILISDKSGSYNRDKTLPISVEGKVSGAPNIATSNFSILTTAKTAEEAQNNNAEKINAVIEYLKSKGIKSEDIKTSNFNLYPNYFYPYDYPRIPCPAVVYEFGETCPPKNPVIVSYSLNQGISIKLRDLNKTGEIISGVVSKGVNQIEGVYFSIEDPDKLKSEARENAIKKAREQAEQLAKLGKFRLGRVISIQESPVYLPQPYSVYPKGFEVNGRGGGGPVDIQPGSQDITVNLTVIFEIK